MLTSQSVKAKSASMVLSGETPGREVDEDLGVLGGVVLDVAHLDLALLVGLDDALDQAGGGGAEGDLVDHQGLVVLLADARPAADAATALALL
jgi:hypothetical protein